MKLIKLFLLNILLLLTACSTNYTTPPSGVNLVGVNDSEISDLMSREPLAQFPANIAIARLQASNYSTLSNDSYGNGQYSVVTTRDVEAKDSFKQMSRWNKIAGVAPIGRLLLPSKLQSMHDIRKSAAQLKADLVFVYTIDTSLLVEGEPLGPLSLVSLGILSKKTTHVSSTTSGAMIDVRTGFVYGVSEATEKGQYRSSILNSTKVIEATRLKVEAESFTSLMAESEELWANIVRQYDN